VVSVETAAREARERGICFHGELLLYVVHGFLHLSGYDDVDPEARALMHSEQERIWSDVLAVQTRLSVEKNGSRSGGERRASSRCGAGSAGE
jgi:probable rRNA maturation factor